MNEIKNGKLLSIITKNTILAIISILQSIAFIACLFWCILPVTPEIMIYCFSIIILMHVMINFICIALSYTFFDSEYTFFCGYIDSNCGRMLSAIITLNNGSNTENCEKDEQCELSGIEMHQQIEME